MGIPLTVQWLGPCCLMEGTTGSLGEELTFSKLHRETKLEKKKNQPSWFNWHSESTLATSNEDSFFFDECDTSTKIDHILDNLKSVNKFKSNEII